MITRWLFLLVSAACLHAQNINGITGQYIAIPAYSPTIVQKVSCTTGSTAKTLVCTFAANTTRGNTLIDSCGGSNYASSTWAAAVTDSQGNTFTQDVIANQSTTQFAAIFRATNTLGGTADALTLTISGASSANESLACEAYELLGTVAPASPLDQTSTGSNAGSTTPSVTAVTPTQPNEIAFAAIAAGTTSSPTITAGTAAPWILDSGTLAPASGSLTFGVESVPVTSTASLSGTATLSASNAWAEVMATYRVFTPNILVTPDFVLPCYVQSGTGTTASTNSTSCKASAGGLYGVRAINTTATLAYLRMYNSASAPTCSSATGFIESIPIPANASGAGLVDFQGPPVSYSTGIGFCVTGGGGNTDNTNAVAGVYITVKYK